VIITSLGRVGWAHDEHVVDDVDPPIVAAGSVESLLGGVQILHLIPDCERAFSAVAGEQALIVLAGEVLLAQRLLRPGTVIRIGVGESVTLVAGGAAATVLHIYGGPLTEGLLHPTCGPMGVFDIDAVADSPAHDPDLGFFHMQGRLLISGPSNGRRTFTVGLGTFAPDGGCHGLHRHAHAEEVFYVWEGVGAHLTDDGVEHRMTAGELVWVPLGEWHGFRNTGAQPLRAVFCYLGVDQRSDAGYEVMPRIET